MASKTIRKLLRYIPLCIKSARYTILALLFDRGTLFRLRNKRDIKQFIYFSAFHKIYRGKLQPIDKIQNKILVAQGAETTVYPIKHLDEPTIPPIQVQSHNLYVAQINSAIALGRSLNVFSRGLLYNELLSIAQDHPNHFVSDRGLVIFNERVVRLGDCYWLLTRRCAPIIVEDAISLLSHYSWNYYHFIYEVVSKLYTLSFTQIDDNTQYLLSSHIRDCASMHAMINLFVPDEHIVWVEDYQVVKAKRLTFCSCPNIITPNFYDIKQCEYSDIYFNKEALLYVRTIVLSKLSINEATGGPDQSRFFITRRNYPNRKYNESELSEVAAQKGYALVDPSELSFEEQVRLFWNASIIIGASGSAFANLLFCHRKTKLLCIMSHDYKLPIFSTIAQMLELDLEYVIGDTDNENDIQSGFYLSPTSFSEILNQLEKSIIHPIVE